MQSTHFEGEIADDAVNIFGGRGLTKTGMGESKPFFFFLSSRSPLSFARDPDARAGKHIEALKRTAKFNAILGGAEEVLGDLGVRQAMRKMPSDVRL